MRLHNNFTGTQPVVVHSPQAKPIWDEIVRKSNLIGRAVADPRLSIITWNNFKTSVLEECLSRRGIPYYAMGKSILVWNNLLKIWLNIEAMNNMTCEYVMGLDSHDVLFFGSPTEAVEKFEGMNCDMVFNGECIFYPDLPLAYYRKNKSFQDRVGQSKYRFLNSGAWMGRRESCIAFFEECRNIRMWELLSHEEWKLIYKEEDFKMPNKLFNCDQSVVHDIFRKNHPRVQLDYQCELFYNIANVPDEEIGLITKLL